MSVMHCCSQHGTYRFDGHVIVTAMVADEVPMKTLHKIIELLQEHVTLHGGLDYLQVFRTENDQIVWVIDHHDDEMKADPLYSSRLNHYTILFPQEY